MRLLVWQATIFFACAVFSPSVAAQEADPPSAPQPVQADAPDVVLLRNGGMIRGTISELVPNERVIIVTAAGERREFAMSEVTYAGPKANAPGPSAPPAHSATQPSSPPPTEKPSAPQPPTRPMITVHGAEAQLRLVSDEPGVTFHRRSGSATAGAVSAVGFDEICTSPCEISMPAGSYAFGLSKGEKPPAEAEVVNVPPGRSTVHGRVIDRSAVRLAGWGLAIVGTGVGIYLVATSTTTEEVCDSVTGCEEEPAFDTTKATVGTVIALGSILIGTFVLAQTPDGAEVRISAGAASTPMRRQAGTAELDNLAAGILPGLTLAGSF